MKVLKLSSQYINQIMNLEAKLHPPEFRLPRASWVNNFQQMENSNCNLSWGLMDGYEIVGYFIAHMGTSYQEDSKEDVIIVDDMAISPEFRKHLFTLLKSFAEEVKKRKIPDIPLESLSTLKAVELLKSHEEILARLGYEIVCAYPFKHENKDLVWLRFERIEA